MIAARYRLIAGIVAAAVAGLAPDAAAARRMVPKGQEPLVARMSADLDRQLGGCSRDTAAIERDVIRLRYTCRAERKTVELLLVDRDSPEAVPLAMTTRFAVLAGTLDPAPPALIDALVTRVQGAESTWVWDPALVPAPSAAATPAPSAAPSGPPPGERFGVGFNLYRKKRHREAFEHFMKMGETTPPYSGVLGMIVSNLAPLHPTARDADRYAAESDAHPDRPLPAFVAGIAAHYAGQYAAWTESGKRALYEQAVKYLEQTLPAYAAERAVHQYLALAHHRLGYAALAEQHITTALSLAPNDPDLYYCRAEIFAGTQPDRAVADLDQYLSLVSAQLGAKSALSDTEVTRVRGMRARLFAVQQGQSAPAELFDTQRGPSGALRYLADWATRPSPSLFAVLAGVVAALAVATRRARRRRLGVR